MERMRRLRARPSQPVLRGPRETPPGPTTWVRPATGWWRRMNAGESPPNQGRTVWAPLSVARRRSRGLRKTPQWSAARRTPYVTGRAPQGVKSLPRAFRRSAPSRFEGASPRWRGDGNARRSPRLARTGAAELWLLHSPAVGSVNRMIAHERSRAFWRNEPNAVACATLVLKPPP